VLQIDLSHKNNINMATRHRPNNEINAGSMADIAFLLLIFFLVTTTISEDKGILVKLPPWTPDQPEPTDVKQRNVYSVLINANNELLVRKVPMDIKDLKSNVKNFILNPNQDILLSEDPTQAVISLKNDRGTEYKTYIEVYNELRTAYNELWEEIRGALSRFGKSLQELSVAQQKQIKDDIPLVISEAEQTAFGEDD
jgi:biopolymer transport protein ExbD